MRDDTDTDGGARQRIIRDLDSTLFVEAGAGSGKTTALIDRLLSLVATGKAEIRNVAAITFTEKAALELRDRLRSAFERRAAEEPGHVAARFRTALDQLDGAAIGTLHAFARRLLSEHPVEAGLPPRIEVLDEVSSVEAFERRWSSDLDRLLDDPALARTILLFLASGARLESLRTLAQAFEANWDLVEERVGANSPDPPQARTLLGPALVALDEVRSEQCHDPSDKLRIRIEAIAQRMSELATMTDEVALIEALAPDAAPPMPSFKLGAIGKQSAFDTDIDELKARVRAVGDRLAAVRSEVATACVRQLGSAIRESTLESARARQRAGQLEFHDLLVLARALLRDRLHGASVRQALHDRYQRLLLDEFQDTDPIQIELAVRIAASHPLDAAAGSAAWDSVSVTPGHLFIVGDPKQSIYRFRRADIATFLAARDRFARESGGTVELTANFRTVGPIVHWVNDTFATLAEEPQDIDDPLPSRPRYVRLTPTRSSNGHGPPVAVMGRDPHPSEATAEELRQAEADEVADVITEILSQEWTVEDPIGTWRPARLSDIAILVPARTSLPFLEEALEDSRIAFRTESSSLVYSNRAVRDLLMVLRAADDPTNSLHVVSALRTPLLACGDDDLFRFIHDRGGSWNYLVEQPSSVPVDDVVRMGLEYLRSVHRESRWMTPSELIGRIVDDRRVLELALLDPRPRDVWRRLRFVTDQARAWADASGGNLRQYLRWVTINTTEAARVTEAILPETDDDAVRIMTVHGAKGLEFPITVLSGMSTVPSARRAAAEVVFPPSGEVGYRFGSTVTTEEYRSWAPIDEQMGLHERIRLLYVACTRARDHLVVSLHRKRRARDPAPAARTNAELLLAGTGHVLAGVPDASADSGPATNAVPPASRGGGRIEGTITRPDPPEPLPVWEAEREGALDRAARPSTIAATALNEDGLPDSEGVPDPGLFKRARDLDLPPWLKGRYGTAIGRAVHGVLQTLDLVSGTGLSAAVDAQCEAEAIPERRSSVRSLVQHALASPSVREAAHLEHWREVYVCTRIGGRLLEGYIDLLYRSDDGLVIVDYKTSATPESDEIDRRTEAYRLQGSAYALAVAETTGERVARVTFVFLTPSGPIERDLRGLEHTMQDVASLVSRGQLERPSRKLFN